VRGIYATEDVKQGAVLAKIPMSGAIWFPADYSDFAELGAIVAREVVKGADSRHAPYLAALPMAREALHTISFETFPTEYVHLIQNELMVRGLIGVGARAWGGRALLCDEGEWKRAPLEARVVKAVVSCLSKICEKQTAGPLTVATHNLPLADRQPNNTRHAPYDAQTSHITNTQSGTLNYWGAQGVELLRDGVSLDRLRAALVTVSLPSLTRQQPGRPPATQACALL